MRLETIKRNVGYSRINIKRIARARIFYTYYVTRCISQMFV